MAASYPTGLPTKTAAGANLGTDPHSTLHDSKWDEIVAIATELGLVPSGSDSTVRARLDRIDDAWASFTPSWTNLTIGNGTEKHEKRTASGRLELRGRMTFGSTSSISGVVSLTLPDSETGRGVSGTDAESHGWAMFDDGTDYDGISFVIAGDTRLFFAAAWDNADAYHRRTSMAAAVPFTWAAGNRLEYEIAVTL